MINVRRMGAATFKTTDLDRSLSYFGDMIGLIPVERSSSRAVLATAEGLEVIALERASEGGLVKLSFQIPSDDLEAAAVFLRKQGIEAKSATGLTPGVAKAIEFTDPLGTQIELFSGYTFAK